MISVNELIQIAYTRTGLVGDGQSVNGTRAKTALIELNALINQLNLQEYLADNLKSFDVSACEEITIGNSDELDIKTDFLPTHIKSVARKIGNRFIPLHTSTMEAINAYGKSRLSTQYTYNVKYDETIVTKKELKQNVTQYDNFSDFPTPSNDYIGTYAWDLEVDKVYICVMTGANTYIWRTQSNFQDPSWRLGQLYDFETGANIGVITLDSTVRSDYKIVCIAGIPSYELDDRINLQDMYNGLLISGLSYKLSIRYKVQDWVGTFKDEFDEQKSLIKRINSTNRNLTWDFINDGSYTDSYYNGINGQGW